MLIPMACPYRQVISRLIHSMPWEAAGTAPCCRPGSRLLGIAHLPLCQSIGTESEVYRLTWESSFEGRAVVRVGRSAAGIAASWSRSDSLFAPEELGVQANISGDAWKRLRRAVDDLGLWGLTREGEYFGLDGATLQVEGRRGMVYRSIKRCSPRGPLWFVGRLLCDIAGPPLSTLDL